MEIIKNNTRLSAVVAAGAAVVIGQLLFALLSLVYTISSVGLSALFGLLFAAVGMFAATAVLNKRFLEGELSIKTVALVSIAGGVAALVASFLAAALRFGGLQTVLMLAADYFILWQLLSRTVAPVQAVGADGAKPAAPVQMSEKTKKNLSSAVLIVVIVALAVLMSQCGGGGSSSSGKKWSDLTDTEKDNARWAHEVWQSIHEND